MLKITKDDQGTLIIKDGENYNLCIIGWMGMVGENGREIKPQEVEDAILAYAAEHGPQPAPEFNGTEPRHLKVEMPMVDMNAQSSLIGAIGAKPQKVEIIF